MGVFYGSSSSSSGQRPGDESTIKRQRTGGPALHFKALQFSWTSLALAGVDNHGKVSFLKLSVTDISVPLPYLSVPRSDLGVLCRLLFPL